MKLNARRRAFEVLCQLMKQRQALTFTQTDTALTKELCFGVCRQYYRLERQLDRMIAKRPPAIEVWIVLMLGLYQLQNMRKPPYAVVQETVGLLDTPKFEYAKGFVNALLRRFCREEPSKLEGDGDPVWLLEQLKQDWKGHWREISNANDVHPPMTLRVNLQRTTTSAYLARLEKAGLKAKELTGLEAALRLETPTDVQSLPGFSKGEVSIQDSAAQLALNLLDLKADMRFLDACAAPGGKLCHVLEHLPTLKTCLALDKDPQRLERITENLQRLHLSAELKQADAIQPDAWWDGQQFDRILLDAPCSGTGVIRRHPDIRVLRQAKEVTAIAKTQMQLLKALWPLLKKGGRLVYATCSVLRQENDQQISDFLAQTPDVNVVPFTLPWGRAVEPGWQLLPGEGEGDGFYYAVLEKVI